MNMIGLESWYKGVPMGLMVVFFTGIILVRGHKLRVWSLQRRLELRYMGGLKLNNKGEINNRSENGSNSKLDGVLQLPARILKNLREQSMDKEIIEAIAFLRNLATLDRGKTSSSDYIIERLSEQNGILQPIYVKMLSLLRINQPDEAAEYFAQKVGTTAGRDFAGLLIQWDRLDPSALLETLLSYEKSIKAVRVTYQKKRDEMVSELVYFPVVVHILVIFVNFIYVAYFIDQKELLQMFM